VLADAASGARQLEARTDPGGSATVPFKVTPTPKVQGVEPAHLAQPIGDPASVRVTVSGQALPRFTAADVSGSRLAVTAAVESATADYAVVLLTIPGAHRPRPDWDPTEPGGPLKPPRPPVPEWEDVPITLTLRSDAPAMTVALTLAEVTFVEV
jgi:hypothetical protein